MTAERRGGRGRETARPSKPGLATRFARLAGIASVLLVLYRAFRPSGSPPPPIATPGDPAAGEPAPTPAPVAEAPPPPPPVAAPVAEAPVADVPPGPVAEPVADVAPPSASFAPPAARARSAGSASPRRRPRRRIVVPVVLATIFVAGGAVLLNDGGSEPTPAPAPSVAERVPDGLEPIGVYIGPGDRAGFEQFATWLGRRPAIVSDGLEELRWEAVVDPWWLLDAWRDADAEIAYSLVMIPREEGGTLQRGAAGEYDAYFRELAQRLVAGGQGDAILRPGWEFSGDWQPWSAREDPAAWKAYFRRIVEAMREVPESDFTFVWNPALGPVDPDNWPAELAWPGKDVVDAIGVDPYDVCFVSGTYPIPDDAGPADTLARQERCWQELLTGDHGLEWYADFAERHDRPLVIPEYGLVPLDRSGGGDNPTFIQGMADFAREYGVAWMVYFNKEESELGNHRIDDDTYPRSSALFRSLYGPDPPQPDTGATVTSAE